MSATCSVWKRMAEISHYVKHKQYIGRIPLLNFLLHNHSCFLLKVHILRFFILGVSGTNKSVAELTYAWQNT